MANVIGEIMLWTKNAMQLFAQIANTFNGIMFLGAVVLLNPHSWGAV